jgi:hypothetical protein
MREMMDPEHWKQRREEMLREAELSRRTRALRATRKRTGWRSAWTWEMRMYAGHFFKVLRIFKSTGYQ